MYFHIRNYLSQSFSLHIHSMWETICDAKASRMWQGKTCAQNPQKTLFWNLLQNTPPPPWKLKFRQILALWVLTFQNTPPPVQWWLEYVETNRCIPQGYYLVPLVITTPTSPLMAKIVGDKSFKCPSLVPLPFTWTATIISRPEILGKMMDL